MPELEIHHESEHAIDPLGQKVGVLAAALAVALAVVSIASHRTHTAAIIHKSAANDAWAHYQSARVKYHNLELGENLLEVLGTNNAAADKMHADYSSQLKKYGDQSADIQKEAQRDDTMADADEDRGLRYDIGEGLLEIAVVVCSLYFISRKKLFPVIALIAGSAGMVVAIAGMVFTG
ncbi:MAG TPA: DUF4337 domain-containing protein [Bryobacteraceae bacterium]|nr:DUF4337 domain-containing protein [Bryobacteraceae bacterium]